MIIQNYKNVNIDNFSNLIIYDLGLNSSQKRELKLDKQIQLRRFPFEQYPNFYSERNKEHVGYWDFNPISGCYLEKNIIESTEAFKLGTNITEIRNSGHTYKLLNDPTIKNQTTTPEVCKKFLDIIPAYYFENTSYIFSTYKVFINNFSSPTQACQYKSIVCESGYWFWIIGTISNYIFGISLLVLFIKKKTYIYDISVYGVILLLVFWVSIFY